MTVVRTVVVGLAVLLVMTVATGLVVTGSAPGSWVVHLTLLAPMLAGLAATLAHPGPHVIAVPHPGCGTVTPERVGPPPCPGVAWSTSGREGSSPR